MGKYDTFDFDTGDDSDGIILFGTSNRAEQLKTDNANMAKQPAGYGVALGNAFAASAGGDGGALPSYSTTEDAYQPPRAEPVTPAADPLKGGVDTGMNTTMEMPDTKPVARTVPDAKIGMPAIRIPEAKPAVSPMKPVEIAPASPQTRTGTGFGKVRDYLNRTAEPERIESENTVTQGREIAGEAQAHQEAVQNNAGAVAPKYYEQPSISDPELFLAKVKSQRWRNESANTLYSLFNAASEEAHALADVANARFNPTTINRYNEYEKAIARDTVSTALNKREEVRFDPEIAKKQAYPIFDRNYQAAAFDSDALSGILKGSFSGEELKGQIRDHMLNGSEITYAQAKQVADGMASLDKTVYGKTVKNFVASIGRGEINFSRDMVHTAAQVLSSAPPPEIAMFHYQQMYNANAHDLAGWAKDVENMTHFGVRAGNNVSDWMGEKADMLKSQRSDDYNSLQYWTLDPAQSAFLRGDRLVGDFFEKLVPAVASMSIPGKAIKAAAMGWKAGALIQLSWAAKMGFNSGASARREAIRRDPSIVDKNPQWHQYKRESFLPEAQARERFIEVDSWQSGLYSGLLSAGTYIGAAAFRHVTTSGAEGPVLQWLQRFVLGEAKYMTKEASDAVRPDFFIGEEGGANKKEY